MKLMKLCDKDVYKMLKSHKSPLLDPRDLHNRTQNRRAFIHQRDYLLH